MGAIVFVVLVIAAVVVIVLLARKYLKDRRIVQAERRIREVSYASIQGKMNST